LVTVEQIRQHLADKGAILFNDLSEQTCGFAVSPFVPGDPRPYQRSAQGAAGIAHGRLQVVTRQSGIAAGFVVLGAYAVFVEFASGYPLGQVAHGAHLGGAALGYTAHRMNWFVDWADHAGLDRPNWFAGLLQRAREKRAERRQQNARQQQLQLDEILDKVKQHGLASLSPEERRFLERMSKQARRD
jgi:hypothetical protein